MVFSLRGNALTQAIIALSVPANTPRPPQEYPVYSVQGREFSDWELANAYAFRISHELGREVKVMEKIDDLTPAYALNVQHPNPIRG